MQLLKQLKIPLSVLIIICTHFVGVIWWLAKLDADVKDHEEWVNSTRRFPEHLYRMDERVTELQQDLQTLEGRVYGKREQ